VRRFDLGESITTDTISSEGVHCHQDIVIVKGDIKNAVQLYKQLRQNEPDKYNFVEDQLNILGYQLLNRNMVKAAIEIFKLNVKAYPESGNVYDSLAEAYIKEGNKEMAIKFYLKSLEKDPNNENARGMLNQLGIKKDNV
jgi:Putative Zn-dependent protease, contains TPR repeats